MHFHLHVKEVRKIITYLYWILSIFFVFYLFLLSHAIPPALVYFFFHLAHSFYVSLLSWSSFFYPSLLSWSSFFCISLLSWLFFFYISLFAFTSVSSPFICFYPFLFLTKMLFSLYLSSPTILPISLYC